MRSVVIRPKVVASLPMAWSEDAAILDLQLAESMGAGAGLGWSICCNYITFELFGLKRYNMFPRQNMMLLETIELATTSVPTL